MISNIQEHQNLLLIHPQCQNPHHLPLHLHIVLLRSLIVIKALDRYHNHLHFLMCHPRQCLLLNLRLYHPLPLRLIIFIFLLSLFIYYLIFIITLDWKEHVLIENQLAILLQLFWNLSNKLSNFMQSREEKV